MEKSQTSIPSSTSFGDALVDGLFAGLGAGLMMAVFLVFSGLLLGTPAETTLARFDPNGGISPFVGGMLHLAVSGIYGMIFAVAGRLPGLRSKRWHWLVGLFYGALLWGIAYNVLLPSTGSSLRQIAPVHFAAAHMVYGLVVGLLTARQGQLIAS